MILSPVECVAIGVFILIFIIIIYSITANDPSGLINRHFEAFTFFSIISLFYLIINLISFAQQTNPEPGIIVTSTNIRNTLAVISIVYILFKLNLFNINLTSSIVNILLLVCIALIIQISTNNNISSLFSTIMTRFTYEYYQLPEHSFIIYFGMLVILTICLGDNLINPIIQYFLFPKHTQLVSKAIYTNTLQNYQPFQLNKPFNYQYSISCWIYINPQPPNTSPAYNKYSSLLNYGNKPNIMYKGRDNDLMIQMLKGEHKQIKTFHTKDLLLQKWNHIVINYVNNNLDVFLNTKLVGSEANITPFMSHDMITTGENNGIHGGIKYIYHFNKPLYLWQINYLYSQK